MDNQHIESNGEQMRHRQITLADGRYMIFYTFGETNQASVEEDSSPDSIVDRETKDV